jgi:hypothetical protein
MAGTVGAGVCRWYRLTPRRACGPLRGFSGGGVCEHGSDPPAADKFSGERPAQAVASTNPASAAMRSAWYDERTIGPDATWVKPSASPNSRSESNSSGVQ